MSDTEIYHVPPEEHHHDRTFMQWPVSRIVHPDPAFLDMVQQTIAGIANAISRFEPVVMLAEKAHHGSARARLSESVELWDIPAEDLWCRDSGPLFVIDGAGRIAISQIEFNGWGNKQLHKHDARIAGQVAEQLGLEMIPSGLVGEPGGVEQDGSGLLMAHESCWVNENRNPGLTRDEIERRLLAAYGARSMIWSEGVRGLDITDYHIDSLARFTGKGRVLINLPSKFDSGDPFHVAARKTHDALAKAGLTVDAIPEPGNPRNRDADFVASYANFYVCNGGVIAASFGDDITDELAVNALKRHYPDREIVSLNVDPLGEMGGGIHCATQQMPTAATKLSIEPTPQELA
ncbi:MAG: agmatine deiminase family protein [Novosphingobium sp.]|nr:agmatine deiminase family protein [Novosphingobium sp.]